MKLLDANIFLAVLFEEKHADACDSFLHKVKEGVEQGIVTDFAVDAIVIAIQRHNASPSIIREFLSDLRLYRGLVVYSLSIEEKILATNLMEKHGLDFDDSLQLQAMHSNNIKEIVSFDRDFDKVKEIKRIQP